MSCESSELFRDLLSSTLYSFSFFLFLLDLTSFSVIARKSASTLATLANVNSQNCTKNEKKGQFLPFFLLVSCFAIFASVILEMILKKRRNNEFFNFFSLPFSRMNFCFPLSLSFSLAIFMLLSLAIVLLLRESSKQYIRGKEKMKISLFFHPSLPLSRQSANDKEKNEFSHLCFYFLSHGLENTLEKRGSKALEPRKIT